MFDGLPGMAHARLCREEAGHAQHRALHALLLREAAAALEREAATWQLLWHLHGRAEPTFPGGTGGVSPLGDAGAEPTVAQRFAAMLAEDKGLNRHAPSTADVRVCVFVLMVGPRFLASEVYWAGNVHDS